MKALITTILFLICFKSYSQDYTIAQINATWNTGNDVELPSKINNYKVIYGILEEQPKSLREKLKAVPVVIIYKGTSPIAQWNADISFKLNLTKEQIADVIEQDKQAHNAERRN